MARVTVEDCLEKEENRFALVVLAAQRCRELMKGEPALVNSKNKAAVIALREIAKGKVHWECSVPTACYANRLSNGNTLVASVDSRYVVEVDREGKEVWRKATKGRPFRARRY